MTTSPGEAAMIEYLAYHGIDGYRRELVFAPPRMWRFDFAFEMDRFAVEVEGILWLGDSGRHQRAKGFEDDARSTRPRCCSAGSSTEFRRRGSPRATGASGVRR